MALYWVHIFHTIVYKPKAGNNSKFKNMYVGLSRTLSPGHGDYFVRRFGP